MLAAGQAQTILQWTGCYLAAADDHRAETHGRCRQQDVLQRGPDRHPLLVHRNVRDIGSDARNHGDQAGPVGGLFAGALGGLGGQITMGLDRGGLKEIGQSGAALRCDQDETPWPQTPVIGRGAGSIDQRPDLGAVRAGFDKVSRRNRPPGKNVRDDLRQVPTRRQKAGSPKAARLVV